MKKLIYTLLIIIVLTNNSFSAGNGNDNTGSMTDNYTKASKLIKAAKKYEQKGKVEKAQKK